ncbi:PhoH family protein [Lentimicrobium sp.]|jgi:phosphate starvation-inducible PhoH-like protein|uniref:PhoH family protein n=1 Tax=Lentimicrobium sp. TaxID=2034841 RepID=UPI002C79BBB6|nr:PhoH family protein [Lentimicrobium sp.]HOP14589.1 PhoH family protein [Lentimicrobium sp.]HPF65545.1 PhoH family protein [Lentimicrobium sp.]HPR25531.1 PhoH family protein [Lentimicrobium sp.]HRW69877.1 PhoH family protein [Lentimicrobium sp.]
MSEKVFSIESHSPLEFYGVGDRNLNIIRELFPKLKLIARGEFLKVIGDPGELVAFEDFFTALNLHFERFGTISENELKQLSETGNTESMTRPGSPDVLVHGRNGMIIKARTPNQMKIVESVGQNDMVFAIGPAGTGKTYTAVALAVRALKNKEVKRIILTRPAVEAGENLGFLPGDMKEKLDPYMQPLYDALRDMLPPQKLLTYIEDGTIEIAPLAFMRGRTLDNVFAILDEAQNATNSQLKMFLTRMGRAAKFFITGDITQIDLPRQQQSGLLQASRILKDIPGIDFIMLDESDVVRHKLVTRIIRAYEREMPQPQKNQAKPTAPPEEETPQQPVNG